MPQGDVICALATGSQAAGIGVIRISGSETFSVVEKVFFPVDKSKSLACLKGYTALFGEIRDEKGLIDEGIATVFRAPRSFTGENTVELSLHGGAYVLSRTLTALIKAGARGAEAGEFTKRAFLNGKLDLTAAEAVMDTVSAQGEMQLRLANAGRSGALYRRISAVRNSLTEICAHAAAWCDFPEEDVEELTKDKLLSSLQSAKSDILNLLKSAEAGLAVNSGIRTSICGRPNVGKSTVMNLLSGKEKSIVTSIPGTTRDVVEGNVNVNGITLLLADTAGLRETSDEVEKIGVEKSRESLKNAGLLICVFDGSAPCEGEDLALIEESEKRPAVIVINKSDLGLKKEWESRISTLKAPCCVISAREQNSLFTLSEKISEVIKITGTDLDGGMLTNTREIEAAVRAREAVDSALLSVEGGLPPDITAVCLEDAVVALGEITGENASESVIEKVFANFCVGK